MLEHSFIFLDRVGLRTEQRIWRSGITDWQAFLDAPSIRGFSRARKSFYDRRIAEAARALEKDDLSYFTERLPVSEHYRLWDLMNANALYIDIETSSYYGDITVIGVYDGEDALLMVRDKNLDKHGFQKAIKDASVLLTFNGLSFDIPVIKRFWNIDIPHPHIDLRFVCKRIGLSGGLKVIEKLLDIRRCKDVQDMMGEDAIYLWQMWKTTGNERHLEKLLAYNREDIVNLKPLAEYAIPSLWNKVFNGTDPHR